MSEVERCRRRLRFLAERRAMREMEEILTHYLAPRLATLDQEACHRLIALLEHGDLDLWDWLGGNTPVPAQVDGALLREIVRALTES